MPKLSLSTLASGARQLVVQDALLMIVCEPSYCSWLTPMTMVRSAPGAGGARGTRAALVAVSSGRLVWAARDDGGVVAGRRRRDDDLLRAALVDVLAGVVGLGEEPGGLDDDVDAEVAPRQVRRVALGEHLHRRPADRDAVAVGGDLLGQDAEDAVVLQQVGEDLVAGQVVDRHDLDVLAAGRGRPPEVAADPAEPVDPHPHRHC